LNLINTKLVDPLGGGVTPGPTLINGVANFTGCVGDADCDGVADASDNCPTVYNPDQKNGDANNAALGLPGYDNLGDACDDNISGDGYTNEQHVALGKNPASYCAIMRADIDGSGTVTTLDLNAISSAFGHTFTHNYYPPNGVDTGDQRLDQDGNNTINIIDLSIASGRYGQSVLSCP
jgi:hypothetical protein